MIREMDFIYPRHGKYRPQQIKMHPKAWKGLAFIVVLLARLRVFERGRITTFVIVIAMWALIGGQFLVLTINYAHQ